MGTSLRVRANTSRVVRGAWGRRGALLIYASLFLTTLVSMAIIPLLPRFTVDFDLSRLEVGAVLAGGSFTSLVVALPVGALADRIDVRRLVLLAAAILTGSTLGQGFAWDFWSLLGARALFGVSLGAFWTAGLALLFSVVPEARRSNALGAAATIQGAGQMIGPAYGGLIAQYWGIQVLFAAIGIAAGVLTLALATLRRHESSEWIDQPVLATFRQSLLDNLLVASLLIAVMLGLVNGAINFLAPLQLHENGASLGSIGLVFSAAAGVFVGVSAVVARFSIRLATLRVATLGFFLFAVALAPGIIGRSTVAVVGLVLVRAPFWALLSTVQLPMLTAGALHLRLPPGALLGLQFVAWGAAYSVAPIGAGVIVGAAGDRAVYTVLSATLLTAAVWTLMAARADNRARRRRACRQTSQ